MTQEVLKCTNSFGNSINFSQTFPYFLEKTEGLHEKSSELSSAKDIDGVGEYYLGRSVNKRNIIIYGYFKDKFTVRKQYLYNVFPDDDEGTLYYYEGDFSAKINYRVEKVSITEVGPIRYFMISLICHNPYFTDLEETKISLSSWIGGIEFPLEIPEDGLEFEIRNSIDIAKIENTTKKDAGLTIIFTATGTVKKPTIKNIINQESLTIDYEMKAGDIIKVTTHINNNNIILISDGIEKNINNYLSFGTRFLRLKPGINNLKIIVEEGQDNLLTELSYSFCYEAV